LAENLKIISKRNRVTARFNYILFPFTSGELMLSINQMNLGFQLLPPPKSLNIPIGVKADWNGPIAKKGNVVIDIDSLPQVLGTDSPSPEDAFSVYLEVEEIVKNTLAKDIDSHTRFYEMISNYTFQTENSPIASIRKIRPENNLYDKIGKIVDEDIVSFAMHVSSSTEIEDSHWFDFKIQPVSSRSHTTFDVMAVYRDTDKTKVDKYSRNVENYIHKIFSEIENSP